MKASIKTLMTTLLLMPQTALLQTVMDWNAEAAWLEYNQQLWENHRISDYTMVLDSGCMACALYFPAETVVEDARIVAVLNPETGEPLRAENRDGEMALVFPARKEFYNTVDDLFAVINRAIENHDGTTHPGYKASSLKVEYDERYGYPTFISVDYHKSVSADGSVAIFTDGGVIHRVTAFEPEY